MAKTTTQYRCTECGTTFPKWQGRCTQCQAWNSLAESTQASQAGLRASTDAKAPIKAARRASELAAVGTVSRTTTGIAEFDRVLGGGLVAGQVLLLAGEPGAGKSTLLLNVADSIATRTGRAVLYVSAEESVEQIAVRAQRIGVASPDLYLADDTDLATVIGHIDQHVDGPALVIVDSVQTVASAEVDGRAGGVTQVMAVAQALTRVAKGRGIPICLVGQVTKDSTVAGPRSLEHIVDTVLTLEGDRHTSLRLLRTVKNRYGPADEIACFEQSDTGMRQVADPSALFRSNRDAPMPGTCITVTMEGRRPMLAEVQALIAPTTSPNPRRGVSGLDNSRVAMLTAVTERTAGIRVGDKDLFTATVGGMRMTDPGADLAICLAIASAGSDRALPTDVAAIGEVTLSGDIRLVPSINARVAEAARLGYKRLLVPPDTSGRLDERLRAAVTLLEIGTLARGCQALIHWSEPPPPRRTA